MKGKEKKEERQSLSCGYEEPQKNVTNGIFETIIKDVDILESNP